LRPSRVDRSATGRNCERGQRGMHQRS
jgi:hypothetical protein